MQLALPTKRTVIPPGLPRVNWAHPLARGLVACYLPSATPGGTLFNLAGYGTNLLANTAPKLVVAQEGMGASCTANGARYQSADIGLTSGALQPATTVSMFWRGFLSATPTGGSLIEHDYDDANDSPFSCYAIPADGFHVWVQTNVSGTYTSGTRSYAPPNNTTLSLGGTVRLGGNMILYVNGVNTVSDVLGAGAIQYNTQGCVQLGGARSDTAHTTNSLCYVSYIWNRELSATEMAVLADDPYGFLVWPDDDVRALLKGGTSGSTTLSGASVTTQVGAFSPVIGPNSPSLTLTGAQARTAGGIIIPVSRGKQYLGVQLVNDVFVAPTLVGDAFSSPTLINDTWSPGTGPTRPVISTPSAPITPTPVVAPPNVNPTFTLPGAPAMTAVGALTSAISNPTINANEIVDCSTFNSVTWFQTGNVTYTGTGPGPNNDTVTLATLDSVRCGAFQVPAVRMANGPHVISVFVKTVSGSPSIYLGYFDGTNPITQYSAKLVPGVGGTPAANGFTRYNLTITVSPTDSNPSVGWVNSNIDNGAGDPGQVAIGDFKSEVGSALTAFGGCGTSSVVVPPPPPAGGRNSLVGIMMDPTADSPAFHSYMGFFPDLSGKDAAMGPVGNGSNAMVDNNGYPVVMAFQMIDPPTGVSDFNVAAAGGYNNIYASTVANNIAPFASTLYAVRIAWEWIGTWESSSPFIANPPTSPATWVAIWRNVAQAFKNNPATAHVKLSWDFPGGAGLTSSALQYYPGDDVVDIISQDVYFQIATSGGFNTSQESWASRIDPNDPLNINKWAAFASQHNKPMAAWEWGDGYSDGFCLSNFANFINTNNFVAHIYWDTNVGLSNGESTRLQDAPARVAAYTQAFANTAYTGNFWTVIPLPASKQAGF